jgi:Domain of unknown function (DUF4331)
MSDHLDGMTVRNDKRLDISDVYLFKGTRGVVAVMNTNPFSGTGGFNHECIYTFNVDIDGDAKPDIALRATFGDPDTDGRQPVMLRLSLGDEARDPGATGDVVATGYTGSNIDGNGGLRLFAGAAADPFYIEPTVVSAVKNAVTSGTALDLSGWDPGSAHNLFAGTNVQTIVVEVPVPTIGLGRRIGFWGSTWVPLDDASGYRQVDRAANPLVSTLFGQDDPFNAGLPENDLADYGEQFQSMIAKVRAANNTAQDDTVYRALLPDILPYVVGTKAYWLANPPAPGKPARNGRDLVGNHPNQAFELVLGMPVDDRLDASSATGTLRSSFPYLSKPV